MTTQNLTVVSSDPQQRSSHAAPLPDSIRRCMKRSFSTRRVPDDAMVTVLTGDLAPRAGDLVLAQISRVKQHTRIEQPDGRRNRLFVGDWVVVCYGNRYAPDQFEAVVPDQLGPCDLVAAGGIAAQMRHRHPRMKAPTGLTSAGLLGDAQGQRLNLSDFRLPSPEAKAPRVPVIVVAGTSMNAGKTTTAAELVHGLNKDGYRVGAAKVTGTGSGGDLWHLSDAGADLVLDFTDAGHASTYCCDPVTLQRVFSDLRATLEDRGAEVVIIEIADGLLQSETAALLQADSVHAQIDGVFFAAADAISAAAGEDWLLDAGYTVLGISGVVSGSPLAASEADAACRAPLLTRAELVVPGYGAALVEQLMVSRRSIAPLRTGQR